jgi:spore coat protein U-like protein
MRRILRYALAALAVGSGAPALAQTATANLAVTATVVNNCRISTNPVAFGSYDPTNPVAVDAAGSVVVTCTASRAWWVGLGAGTGGAAAGVTRSMSLAASRLGYELYTDAGRTTVWANTLPTGVGGTGTGAAQTTAVYGRIAAGQTAVPAGAYSDSVVATVNF